jgi:hypothetical protein
MKLFSVSAFCGEEVFCEFSREIGLKLRLLYISSDTAPNPH